jgi:hypothetical protein
MGGEKMQELEVKASAYRQTAEEDEFEFTLLADELAQALEISAAELVDAIQLGDVECCKMESGPGQLVVEIEVLNKHFRLRIMNPM